MRDFLQGNRRAKLIDWLKIDSWIDSGLYTTWIGFRDWWAGYSSFFGRFEVKGVVRALNELACEGMTLSVGGLLVLATFALPAFETAQGKMNLSDEYSVTFLDRYGNEIGKRGILQRRLGAARRNARPSDQGGARHRGPALLRAFRHRRHRHVPRPVENARANAVVQGGSLAHPAARQEPVPVARSARSSARSRRRSSPSGWRIDLSKQEILKLYLDRAYMGGGTFGVEAAAAILFRQVGQRREPRRGGHARRPVQGADPLRPARQPRRRRAPAPTRC